MEPQAKKYLSPDEYLAIEREAEYKSEYYKGEMFAFSGASFYHNRITENLSIAFGSFLKGKKCQGFSSDLRVHIPLNGLYTYPDFMVACKPYHFPLDGYKDILLNPTLIIEVLSPSTANYDRGKKFQLYQGIASLKEYALVNSFNEYGVQKFYKDPSGFWQVTFSGDQFEDTVTFQSIDFTVSLSDMYEGVTF